MSYSTACKKQPDPKCVHIDDCAAAILYDYMTLFKCDVLLQKGRRRALQMFGRSRALHKHNEESK